MWSSIIALKLWASCQGASLLPAPLRPPPPSLYHTIGASYGCTERNSLTDNPGPATRELRLYWLPPKSLINLQMIGALGFHALDRTLQQAAVLGVS